MRQNSRPLSAERTGRAEPEAGNVLPLQEQWNQHHLVCKVYLSFSPPFQIRISLCKWWIRVLYTRPSSSLLLGFRDCHAQKISCLYPGCRMPWVACWVHHWRTSTWKPIRRLGQKESETGGFALSSEPKPPGSWCAGAICTWSQLFKGKKKLPKEKYTFSVN